MVLNWIVSDSPSIVAFIDFLQVFHAGVKDRHHRTTMSSNDFVFYSQIAFAKVIWCGTQSKLEKRQICIRECWKTGRIFFSVVSSCIVPKSCRRNCAMIKTVSYLIRFNWDKSNYLYWNSSQLFINVYYWIVFLVISLKNDSTRNRGCFNQTSNPSSLNGISKLEKDITRPYLFDSFHLKSLWEETNKWVINLSHPDRTTTKCYPSFFVLCSWDTLRHVK